ncbi:MAG: winged helix-turn-helix domain-containing protein [Candidatus Binatia bacterium]
MASRLSKLLSSRAAESFVGRSAELSLLDTLFAKAGALVVHIHGIGGVGKSALLDAFARRAERSRATALIRLDCRGVEPTERGVVHAVASVLGTRARTLNALTDRVGALGRRVVLVFDNYEVFRLADAWIRQTFVPTLPANARLVLAGRQPPAAAWSTAPEWAGLFCSITLRPLDEREASELLRRIGVPAATAQRINRFARGHPLALKLAARTFERGGGPDLDTLAAQGVIEELVNRYLGDIEDLRTREALNAASVVRRTTRSLLQVMLPSGGAGDSFEKLSSLPFVERDRDGLFVHDAVRSAVAAALRSADPATHQAHRRAAWRQLRAEVRSAGLTELWRYTADLLYLIENPVVREAFFPSETHRLIVEPARRGDGPAILEIVDRHESREAADALKSWWNALPASFHVARDHAGKLCGFYCMFEKSAVDRWSPAFDDPLVREWLAHERSAPLERDEIALFLRRWLADEEGERPSVVQAACFLDIKRTYMELRPRLRRVYTTFCDESAWQSALEKLGFGGLSRESVTLSGLCYHSALLDFGPHSVDGWLSKLAADELGVDGDDLLDISGRRVKTDGGLAALTQLEFKVLQFLMQKQGQAVPRDTLRKEVWGHRGDGASNVVDVIIRSLRKKLGSRASRIETVSGVGYRLCPERALMTLLFVDIVASTERAIALGDDRWRAALDGFHGSVRAQVGKFAGRVVDTAGDGVLAVFAAPAAALRAASAIHGSMASLGLRARAGVHTGECELMGDGVTGISVHLAARVAAAAGAGEVLASATVRDLVAGSGVHLVERGSHRLKGVPGTHRLFAVAAN